MDRGQKETERILREVEKRIDKEYSQAIEEIETELADYLRRFELKDKKWREWVEDGTKTAEEYKQWRFGQLAVGKRWSEQKDAIAEELFKVNEKAKATYKSSASEIFAENVNFATYELEHDAKIDTSFTLYSKESVDRLIKDDPDVLPAPGKKVRDDIAKGKAVRWNRQQLQSVMIQGIIQGDSIPKLATRLANKVGDSNRKAAIRNARTMATGAQNAGRVNAYSRAESKGVEMEQMWLATLDNRTRHSHRWMDRETRPVGEEFSNGCRFPGDPDGAAAEIYNCRCALRGVVKGLERRSGQFRDDSAIGDMTYDEWKDAKSESQDILHQDKVGEAMRRKEGGKYGKVNGKMKMTGAHDMSSVFKDVYYDENAQYKVHIDSYSENINEILSEYAKKVTQDGSKKRVEFAALIDIETGELMDYGDSDDYGSVNHYYPILDANPNRRFAMVHNHNTESTVSLGDLQELASWGNLDSVTAITNNGMTSSVQSNGSKTSEYLPFKYMNLANELRKQGKTDVEIEYAQIDAAIKEYCKGGRQIIDGRRKDN